MTDVILVFGYILGLMFTAFLLGCVYADDNDDGMGTFACILGSLFWPLVLPAFLGHRAGKRIKREKQSR